MNNNWLCITTLENYRVTESKNIWGVRRKYKNRLSRLKMGDKGYCIKWSWQISVVKFGLVHFIFSNSKSSHKIPKPKISSSVLSLLRVIKDNVAYG